MKTSKVAAERPADLEELFRSGGSVDDGNLAAVLKGKVYLSKDAVDRVFIEEGFRKVSASSKLLAVGLALHVLRRKGLAKDEDLAKPAEWYAEQIQDKPKYVLEQLSKLKGRMLFDRTDLGYRIPTWGVRRALDSLAKPD